MHDVLILTAMLDTEAAARFDRLRRAHYPADRNRVPAHLTLFQHLPGTELDTIVRRLEAEARGRKPFAARVVGLRNLGGGVACRVESAELEDIQAALADAFAYWLLPQDRQRFAPHVTIQNKVEPRIANQLEQVLLRGFQRWTFPVIGLTLWRYLGGPWEHIKDFRFR